ncbi:MAG: beta strand repeat-containing protein, partial [Terriglobales bacterium]
RTISFTVNDGSLDSAVSTKTVSLTAVNTPPVVTDTGGTTAWTEASGLGASTAVVIDSGATVADADNATLASAKVQIGTGFQSAEDVLAFSNTSLSTYGNIAASYNAASGLLTLTSAGATATTAQWQAALDAVTYNNSSHNPTGTSRIIDFTVNDGLVDSALSTKTVSLTAVNTPPVVTVAATATYTGSGPAATLSSAATVSDVDNTTLASATVSISNGLLAGDVLSVNGATSGTINGISWSYASGALSFTGSSLLANYQTLLDEVQYSSSSSDPTNIGTDNSRTISWVANDGALNSGTGTTVVSILPSSTAYVWGTSNFIGQSVSGVHDYSPFVAINQNKGVVGVLYGVTSSNYNPSGPDNVSLILNVLDPFFLSTNQSGLVIDSTVQQFPSPYTLSIPDTSSHDGEGIAIYQTEDSGGNRFLNEAFVTGNGDILNIGGATQIAGLLYTTENPLFMQFRETSSALTSYTVAFDQYDPVDGVYTINLETFVHISSDPYDSASDFTASGVITALTFTGLTGGRITLPASFYSSVTSSSGGGVYMLGYAENNAPHVGQDYIKFLSYTETGALNTSFNGGLGYVEIAPDLSAYGSDPSLIHNQITLEATDSTHTGNPTSLFFTQPGGSGPLFVAWNEIVKVDGNPNTYDQVEFVRHAPFLPQVDQYFTYQIPDGQAQDIKLQAHGYSGVLGTGTMVYLGFGDGASTTIVEFFYNSSTSTTTEIGSYTEITPHGHIYNNIRDLGDGRVAIIYDDQTNVNGTTQVTTNIVDFRTTGLNINDSGLTGGNQQQYVAGTHFNDTFIGENNGSNEYYFIGQNSAVGPAPTDTFTGGQFASNVAIFSDPISDFTFTPGPSSGPGAGSLTVTNIGDSLHAGSLTLTGIQYSPGVYVPSVQALAFGPSKDPQPNGGGGALEASAGTLYITGPLNNPV